MKLNGQGSLATHMFIAIDRGLPSGSPDIPKVLDVLKRVTVVA